MPRLVVSWFILFFQAHVVSLIASFRGGFLKVASQAEVLRGSSGVPAHYVYVGGYSGREREKREERACSHVLGTSLLCHPPFPSNPPFPPWFPVD